MVCARDLADLLEHGRPPSLSNGTRRRGSDPGPGRGRYRSPPTTRRELGVGRLAAEPFSTGLPVAASRHPRRCGTWSTVVLVSPQPKATCPACLSAAIPSEHLVLARRRHPSPALRWGSEAGVRRRNMRRVRSFDFGCMAVRFKSSSIRASTAKLNGRRCQLLLVNSIY